MERTLEMPGQELTNVHDAMIRASDVTKTPPLEPYTLKVNPIFKGVCEDICKHNGTTLAEFLRQCMLGLISDYTGAPADDLEKAVEPAKG